MAHACMKLLVMLILFSLVISNGNANTDAEDGDATERQNHQKRHNKHGQSHTDHNSSSTDKHATERPVFIIVEEEEIIMASPEPSNASSTPSLYDFPSERIVWVVVFFLFIVAALVLFVASYGCLRYEHRQSLRQPSGHLPQIFYPHLANRYVRRHLLDSVDDNVMAGDLEASAYNIPVQSVAEKH